MQQLQPAARTTNTAGRTPVKAHKSRVEIKRRWGKGEDKSWSTWVAIETTPATSESIPENVPELKTPTTLTTKQTRRGVKGDSRWNRRTETPSSFFRRALL